MIKRIIAIIILIAIIIGGISIWRTYRSYREQQQARISRLKQQAEDIQITTIEGWTVAEIADYIGQQKLVSTQDFKNALTNVNLSNYPLVAQSKPEKADLEGYLFPDTYRFTKQTTAQAVIDKMLSNFTARMNSVGIRPGQGFYTVPGYEKTQMSFYQLLALASILEKETGSKGGEGVQPAQERALIAGVFYNRLGRGQALESDATINYVTGKNTPAVSSADLGLNSPYNTYKYPGLPPGPICNPSLASIKAVLYPTKTDFNYFFHKQPSGEVVFSKTFAEHVKKKAVQ